MPHIQALDPVRHTFLRNRPETLQEARPLLCHIAEHENKVADASSHDEQVENLVGAEVPVLRVEKRKLQRIDHTARRINQPSGEKPQKGRAGKRVPELAENAQTDPAHGDIDNRGKPFRTGDPESLDRHAENGHTPYYRKQRIAQSAARMTRQTGV